MAIGTATMSNKAGDVAIENLLNGGFGCVFGVRSAMRAVFADVAGMILRSTEFSYPSTNNRGDPLCP